MPFERAAAIVIVASLTVLVSLPAAPQTPGSAVQDISAALRAHDYARALELAESSLKSSPRDPRLWTLAGIADEGLAKPERALSDYGRALTAAPAYLPALKGKAGIEYKTGSPAALQTLDEILKQQPADQTAHAMLGALEFNAHHCAAVRIHYAAAAEAIRSQPAALTQYAQCLLENRQNSQAIQALRQAAELPLNNESAQYNIALAEYIAGDNAAALSSLEPLLQGASPEARVLDLASAAYEAAGDTPKSVAALHRAIVAHPDDAQLYLHFVDLCFAHRSFQTGVDMVSAGLKRLPASAPLYVARGILWAQLAKYDNADADFHKADQLDPAQSFSSLAEGVAELQNAHFDQALETTEAQISKTPGDPFLYYLKAQALSSKGLERGTPELQQAIEAAQHALRLRPDFPLAQNLLGSFYRKAGQAELASRQFESVLAEDPKNQTALYQLSQLEKSKGRTDQARALLKRLAQTKLDAQQDAVKASRYQLVEPNTAPSY